LNDFASLEIGLDEFLSLGDLLSGDFRMGRLLESLLEIAQPLGQLSLDVDDVLHLGGQVVDLEAGIQASVFRHVKTYCLFFH